MAAFIVVALAPPVKGIVLLAKRRARLQVCSIGANVKSPLSFCPGTARP